MKKLVIIYLISSLEKTGPNNILIGIIRHLDQTKFTPIIYTLSSERVGSMKKDFEDLGIRVETFSKSRAAMWMLGKNNLLKIVQEEQPDIIHSHGIRADKAVADVYKELQKRGILTVSTIHCFFAEDYRLMFNAVIGSIVTKKHLKILNHIDIPICCSQALSEKYKEKYGLQFDYINNGINIDNFMPPETYSERKNIRKKLGLPEKKTIFIVVGNLENRKEPLLIIKAFKGAKTNRNAILIFLGDGELKEKCSKEIEGKANILLCGKVKNVHDYLKCADIYISASLSEGLPNAMLEAGAAGLEMIVSDIPQQTKIFEESNIEVETFACHDQKKLSKVIEENIWKEHEINKNMAHFIRMYFSSEYMSENYQKIYTR